MRRRSTDPIPKRRLRDPTRRSANSNRLDRILAGSTTLLLQEPMTIEEVNQWLHEHPPTALVILSRSDRNGEYELTVNMDELESRIEREGIPRTDAHFEGWCYAALEKLVDRAESFEGSIDIVWVSE